MRIDFLGCKGDALGFLLGGCCGENIIACKKGCFVGILYFSGMVIPLSNLDVMYWGRDGGLLYIKIVMSNTLTTYSFKNIEPEDIEDSLRKVEESFGISFVNNELSHIKTFGELCDYISNKIELENQESCTKQ